MDREPWGAGRWILLAVGAAAVAFSMGWFAGGLTLEDPQPANADVELEISAVPETGEPLVSEGTRIVVACGDGASAGRVLESIPDRRVGHWQNSEVSEEGCYAWYHVAASGLDWSGLD